MLARHIIVPALATLAVVSSSFITGSVVAAEESDKYRLHGSTGFYVEGRKGEKSSDIRQDWDLLSDYNVKLSRRPTDWEYVLSGRVYSDIDGRRPADEPGIYNGIKETFKQSSQVSLYRLYAAKRWEESWGSLKAPALRLGRQYQTGADMLWYDGAELTGAMDLGGKNVDVAAYGGIPVRMYDSAKDDWLIGASAGFNIDRARIILEGYHVDDRDKRYSRTRESNVGRLSLSSPIGKNAYFFGTVRGVNDEGFDVRARGTWNPTGGGLQLRADYRAQTENRTATATEVDLASLVLGRSLGTPRRAYDEIGLGAAWPLGKYLSFDLGATTRDAQAPSDVNNVNFERAYATVSVAEFPYPFGKNHPLDITLTGEAYEAGGDWTRHISGEAAMNLSKRLRVSGGTSYALYSYDYYTGEVKDDVKMGTAKIEWTPADRWKVEGRYDLEDDDQRLHHFFRGGVRREF